MLMLRPEDPSAFRRAGIHALAASRSGADEHQAANEFGRLQRDLLRDKAADREAQQVNPTEPERIDEGDRVGPHLRDRIRNIA